MVFFREIFSVAPIPQVIVSGSPDLYALFESDMDYMMQQDFPKGKSTTNEMNSFPMRPFKLCCAETYEWMKAFHGTLESPEKPSTLSTELHYSTEQKGLDFIQTSNSTEEWKAPYSNMVSLCNEKTSLDAFSEASFDWFQRIVSQTISSVVLLLDFRHINLNFSKMSSYHPTSQDKMLKSLACQTCREFRESLKQFFCSKFYDEPEFHPICPNLLVLLVLQPSCKNVQLDEASASLAAIHTQEIIADFVSDFSEYMNFSNKKLVSVSSSLMTLQSSCETSTSIDIRTTFLGIILGQPLSVEPTYSKLKSLSFAYFDNILSHISNPLSGKALSKKKERFLTDIEIHLRMAFVAEYTHVVDKVEANYTYIWDMLREWQEDGKLSITILKIFFFVSCRRLLWLCRGQQFRAAAHICASFQQLLNTLLDGDPLKNFTQKLHCLSLCVLAASCCNTSWFAYYSSKQRLQYLNPTCSPREDSNVLLEFLNAFNLPSFLSANSNYADRSNAYISKISSSQYFVVSLNYFCRSLTFFAQVIQSCQKLITEQEKMDSLAWISWLTPSIPISRIQKKGLIDFQELLTLSFTKWSLSFLKSLSCVRHGTIPKLFMKLYLQGLQHHWRGILALVFHLAHHVSRLNFYAEAVCLYSVLLKLILGINSHFFSHDGNHESFRFLVKPSYHLPEAPPLPFLGFQGYPHFIFTLYFRLVATVPLLLNPTLPLTLSKAILQESLHITLVPGLDALILEHLEIIFEIIDLISNDYGILHLKKAFSSLRSTLLTSSVSAAILGLYDQAYLGSQAHLTSCDKCPVFHLMNVCHDDFMLLLSMAYQYSKQSTEFLLQDVRLRQNACEMSYYFQSFLCFFSAHLNAQKAEFHLLVFHWLECKFSIDQIRIVTIEGKRCLFNASQCLASQQSSSASSEEEGTQPSQSVALEPQRQTCFILTFHREQMTSIEWCLTIQKIEFHCHRLDLVVDVDFWISPRLWNPVESIDSVYPELFSCQIHSRTSMSPTLMKHFVQHQDSHPYRNNFTLSFLPEQMRQPLAQVNFNFLNELLASATLHPICPATYLFYCSIEHQLPFFSSSSCSSQMLASFNLDEAVTKVTSYSDGNDGTFCINKPQAVQLTPEGHLLLQFPNRSLNPLIQHLNVSVSPTVLVDAYELFVVSLTYQSLSQSITSRIYFTIQSKHGNLSPKDHYQTKESVLALSSITNVSVLAPYLIQNEKGSENSPKLFFCQIQQNGIFIDFPDSKNIFIRENRLKSFQNISIDSSNLCVDMTSSSFELFGLPSENSLSCEAKQDLSILHIPFLVQCVNPGEFVLNTFVVLEYKSYVIDLIPRSNLLTAQIPFSTLFQFVPTSSPDFLDPRLLLNTPGPQWMTSPATGMLDALALSRIQKALRQWLKITLKNVSPETLIIQRVILKSSLVPEIPIHVDVHLAVFPTSNVASESKCPVESCTLLPDQQWSCLIQLNALINSIQQSESKERLSDFYWTQQHEKFLQSLSIFVNYSYKKIPMLPENLPQLFQSNDSLNSHLFKQSFPKSFHNDFPFHSPIQMFTFHNSFTIVTSPFSFYVVLVNLTLDCKAYSFQLIQNTTVHTSETNKSINRNDNHSEPFLISGILKSSTFVPPESIQRLSWTLIALKEGTFELPRLVLKECGSSPGNESLNTQTLLPLNFSNPERTEIEYDFCQPEDDVNTSQIFCSPASKITSLPHA